MSSIGKTVSAAAVVAVLASFVAHPQSATAPLAAQVQTSQTTDVGTTTVPGSAFDTFNNMSALATAEAPHVACNHESYTNSSGREVHSPSCGVGREREQNKAQAICRDHSVSYSEHRRGTCSRHKGVAKWL